MDGEAAVKLLDEAKNVLAQNDRGGWTIPQADLYPHQWLWDSCFIAIGLRHINIERAQTELRSLLRGQWSNGMLAHLIFSDAPKRRSQKLQDGRMSPHSPDGINTSGLTQPPLLAEAVWHLGQKMKLPERRTWFKEMLPYLIDYHSWFYAERDTGDGLVVLIHPYESGLDNSPSSMSEVYKYAWPWWLKLLETTRLTKVGNLVRRDLKYVASIQRMNNSEAIAYFWLASRLRRQNFDIKAISKRPRFAVEDLTFNCIFIRANEILRLIARTAGHELPEKLIKNMQRSEKALEQLWDQQSGQYYGRSHISGQLIKETTIAALMPLYSGCIVGDRAKQVAKLLKKRGQFATNWPVPTVAQDSSFFSPVRYWQGPTWVNTNWLIIDGLKRCGFDSEAAALKERTLELVSRAGIVDYYNPLTGKAVGASGFSWTAALTVDLLQQ